MSALEHQIGGNHYKGRKVQPIEFWMLNGWDGCAGSILKYVCRHDEKAGKLDLAKARHFGQIRLDLIDRTPVINVEKRWMTAQNFVRENNIEIMEAKVIYDLESWVYGENKNGELFFNSLNELIQHRYPA